MKKTELPADEIEMTDEAKVHTEQEMRDFALSSLKEKYGKEFVIDETYCVYNHLNGHDELDQMELRARAYPVDEPEQFCGLYVTEPNTFKDNYFTWQYQEGVEKIINSEMEKYGVETKIHIYRSASDETFDAELTPDEFLHQKETNIEFFVPVKEENDINNYIPTIRQWLPFLYSCDYDWYFVLHDENARNKYFFTIMKGDRRITSADDWTDEKLLDSIRTAISLHR